MAALAELKDVDPPAAGDGVDGLHLRLRGWPLATGALTVCRLRALAVAIAVLGVRRRRLAVRLLAVPVAVAAAITAVQLFGQRRADQGEELPDAFLEPRGIADQRRIQLELQVDRGAARAVVGFANLAAKPHV